MTMVSHMLRHAGAAAIAVAVCVFAGPPVSAADYPDFDDASVTKRTEQVIDERSKDGVFIFRDPKLNADLNLIYERIKIVRGMRGYGWFANVIFHDKEEPEKQYAIDFWFKPQREGDDLDLIDIRVQKGPKREGDGYYMLTRLPVAWWWLPVSEHPGTTEDTRAWHVMSVIHNYIAKNKNEDGALELTDKETGEIIPLEFVEMHRPIRYIKKDGMFFACSDFRKVGTDNEYYDIDFWIDEKTGKLKVDEVKIHKVPVQEDGIWTQKELYTFEGMDFEVTN